MNEQPLNQRLSRISTQWSVLFQAHRDPVDAATTAQRLLMQRYGGAVYRYLLGIVRDPDAADDLAQDFAVRFLRGDFHRADPQRGRFRDFVKAALRRLVIDHHRRRQKQPLPLNEEELAVAAEPPDSDRQLLDSWRAELLTRAWEALAAAERETGQPFHAVLRLKADQPELRSPDMAAEMSRRLGRPVTAVAVRQLLHRAREKFAQLLLADVAHSLGNADDEQVQQELLDLGLLEYCRPRGGLES